MFVTLTGCPSRDVGREGVHVHAYVRACVRVCVWFSHWVGHTCICTGRECVCVPSLADLSRDVGRVCVCVCACVHTCICSLTSLLFTHTYVRTRPLYIPQLVREQVCIDAHTCTACVHTCVQRACVCVCVCVCVCARVHVCDYLTPPLNSGRHGA